MTQTVPLVAQLGAANTGLLIGYAVYDIDHVLYSAWSSTGVAESDVPGTYYVTGGVVMPDTGGHIVVGEDGSPLCEVAIDPAPLDAAGTRAAVGLSDDNLDSQLGALPTAAETASVVDTVLSAAHGSGVWGCVGSGAITYTYTLTSSVDDTPIAGADVWVTTDVNGANVVDSGVTDAFGQVTFRLDPGTYYFWRQLAGWSFVNPDTEVVS